MYTRIHSPSTRKKGLVLTEFYAAEAFAGSISSRLDWKHVLS